VSPARGSTNVFKIFRSLHSSIHRIRRVIPRGNKFLHRPVHIQGRGQAQRWDTIGDREVTSTRISMEDYAVAILDEAERGKPAPYPPTCPPGTS